MDLPRGGSEEFVPARGDVHLVASAQGAPVRFFLPLGSSERLKTAGVDVFDETRTLRFTHDSYRRNPTDADVEYESVVRDAYTFGFSQDGRERLENVYQRFADLRKQDPSFFRQIQFDVVRLHRRVWRSRNFDAVVQSAEAARGRLSMPALPLLPAIEPLASRPVTVIQTAD
jgi:hypothetical protein